MGAQIGKAVHLHVECDAGGCVNDRERAEACAGKRTGQAAIDACVDQLRAQGWRVEHLGGINERWLGPKCAARR